jgi:hypothetical protein
LDKKKGKERVELAKKAACAKRVVRKVTGDVIRVGLSKVMDSNWH